MRHEAHSALHPELTLSTCTTAHRSPSFELCLDVDFLLDLKVVICAVLLLPKAGACQHMHLRWLELLTWVARANVCCCLYVSSSGQS